MPAVATRRRPARPVIRDLAPISEQWSVQDSAGAPLRIDEEQCVIYGVKVVGHESPNTHGRPGVTEGTLYSRECLKNAAPLYNGVAVNPNHPANRKEAIAERDVTETVGVLENARFEEHNGDYGIYADLRYYADDPTAKKLVQNVKAKMGGMALSHNALPSREKVVAGKLVIEAIDHVISVDVVQKGGTNSTLWEQRERKPMKTTFKAILENWAKNKSAARKKYAKAILEDDMMEPAADAGVEEPSQDPDEAMWSGFQAAIGAILDQYKSGDLDASGAAKAIAKYLKAHDKLTGSDEPAVEEDDGGEEEVEKKKDEEAAAVESLDLKARLKELEAKDSCRALCEDAEIKPSPVLLKSLMLLESAADRKALIDETKAASATKTAKPKSSAPSPKAPAVTEAKAPANAEEFAKSIRD